MRVIFILTLLFSCVLCAEPVMRFERIGLEQGLSQSSVYRMMQDRQGFIWIATQDGLNRFDGYQFKVFRNQSDNPYSISDNDVITLFQQADGTMWVGTNVGVCRYDPVTSRFHCFKQDPQNAHSLSGSRVHTINEDKDGNLWVGTYGGGLSIFDAQSQQFKHMRYDPDDPASLSSDKVGTIYRDSKGNMWVGTHDKGINRYDASQNHFIRYSHAPEDDNSVGSNKTTDIFEDSRGDLWIATDGGGLNKLNPEKGGFTRYLSYGPDDIGHNSVWEVFEDSRGVFWIAHENGLDTFDRDRGIFSHYRHQSSDNFSLSHNAVHSIMEDRDGIMWFGTYGGGINKHNASSAQFLHYKNDPWNQNSLSNNVIMGMYIDNQDILWLGTDGGGVNRFDLENERFEILMPQHGKDKRLGPAGNKVRAMYQDSDGLIWLSAWNVGISTYDNQTGLFEHHIADEHSKGALHSDRVTGFYEDDQGNIWIFTYGDGISRFNKSDKTFERVNVQFSHVATELINGHFVDDDNQIWLATDGGLVEFNHQTLETKVYQHQTGKTDTISSNIVTSIYKDSRGILWVGTYGGGLNRLNRDDGTFSYYRQQDGLANDSIYGVLEDNLGFLWISTNYGLSKFDPVNERFTNFTVADGLQSNEFNSLAFTRTNRGELLFGGINGFNRFFGENVRFTVNKPKVVFTDVLRFNESVPITPDSQATGLHLKRAVNLTRQLTLDHSDSLVTFRFTALDFANPKSNKFKYKLEGFDQQWITTTAENRRATYTNLPSGSYTLTVKAANAQGVWNEEGTSLQIKVLPPPWLSWWAIMCYVIIVGLFILMLLYLGFEWRKVQFERVAHHQLKQMDQIKDAFLTNTAEQLRTPLSSIIGLAQSLVDGVAGSLPQKANTNLAMVVSSGRRLSNLIDDMLDFAQLSNDSLALNNQPLDLHSLADVVLNITKPLLGSKELLMANRVPKDLPKVMADEVRLQQALYNLVDNAIKFTPKGHISIKAKQKGDIVVVSVVDSGIGISREKLASLFDKTQDEQNQNAYEGIGLGLAISKQLLNLHGTSIKVTSQIGEGSTFSFTLPVSEQQVETRQKAEKLPETNHFHGFDTHFQSLELPGLPEQRQDGHQFRLLLIDDDAVSLEVLHDHLSLQNYQLVKTQDPQQALEMLQEAPFDMVIADIMMSGMSGFELCKQVRRLFPIQDLPIILCTNRGKDEDLTQCYTVGANDCLFKPVSRHELLVRVASHLKMLDITRNLERIVSERTEELEQQKYKVEQKVAQRTADLEQSNRSLSALSQICSEISAILDWDKLMVSVYEHIKELMETEVFLIGLYQPERQRVSFELAIECDELLPNSYIAMYEKNRPAVWCIENKQPLIINDFYEEYAFYFGDQPVPEPKVGGKPHSLVFWPLMSGGRILGVLSVQSFHKNAYTYSELEVIRTVASTTAIALDNAQAYREIEMQKSAVEAKVAQRTEQLESKNKEILATQQQLVQSEKMASLGTLTAGVAHEINNPTNFVHVSAQNLEVDLGRFEQFILALAGDDADEEILASFEQHFKPLHDHIKTIKDGTTRIKGIVKDLRAFTHLDADDKQLADIVETLESTINLTKTQFLEIAEVVTEFNPVPELLCYPAQLSQVFMNLIVNACDAIREKQQQQDKTQRGKITISLTPVDQGIEIQFSDNGMGMNEVTLNKLFEPFYTTKAVGEGTGLGLSISYSIIEKHQGEMSVSSTVGEGTTFKLFLPTS